MAHWAIGRTSVMGTSQVPQLLADPALHDANQLVPCRCQDRKQRLASRGALDLVLAPGRFQQQFICYLVTKFWLFMLPNISGCG